MSASSHRELRQAQGGPRRLSGGLWDWGIVHFVRSRQEERELAFWLALTGYDVRDRSFSNRIYLVYVILFFTVWTFVTLTFFAGGGETLLRVFPQGDPAHAAALLEAALLGAWCVNGLWQAQRRSPVVFSEADAALICQTPISRRGVTARWLAMPWLKSVVPFWLIAITLGFSVAEASLPGEMSLSRIPEYAGFGLRAWLALLPLHLGLYALQWAAGIARLQRDQERRWTGWVILLAAAVAFGGLIYAAWTGVELVWAFLGPLLAGFAHSQSIIALLPGWLFALATLALMIIVSGRFSLNRAAQETAQLEVIQSAVQYGFSQYAEQLQTERRLGEQRAPSRLPAPEGARVLVWKDVLQSLRSLRTGSLFVWLRIFLVMLAFPFLPDAGSRALASGFWVVQVGLVAVIRLRSDLSRWVLARQLPFDHRRFLLVELSPAWLLAVLVSLLGLGLNTLIFHAPVAELALLTPGVAASTASLAAWDVIRRSRSDLLMAGSAPELSATGMISALAAAAVPLLLAWLLPGWIGPAIAALLSLGLGALTFFLAAHAYRNLGGS